MSEVLWRRSDDWVGTEVEDSFVMINLGTGAYVTLNRTACAIWNALEHPRTQAAIETQLNARFEVAPDQCEREVGGLLAEMRALELAAPV